MPMKAIGDAPELLVDDKPLQHRPALATELAREPAPVQAGRDCFSLDLRDRFLRQLAASLLSLDLERHQHVFDESTRPLLQLEQLRVQLRG